ncbi:MAG: HDOD domain-containing protein [Planctomycetaceae bacterium]|jgi:HD-like signal output (HDOD) protein|nr:HDOD domain-containing protein [Planctomycetaceae bacterium]
MSDSLTRENLRQILVTEQLPAMPQSALSVLKLENDLAKVNINDLVRPIETDPGLAAQVLKFLNSSAFGFSSSISNIRQGIALVGIRIVKNFVLWKAVFSLIPKSKSGTFDVAVLWQDSLRRAMFARYLSQELKCGDAEMAFAGALLQDMSIPLLLKLKPAEYCPVLDALAKSDGERLSHLEQKTFGWDHADVGYVLGQQWKLPELLTHLISSHLEIESIVSNFKQQPETAVVCLSSLLPTVTKDTWDEQDTFRQYFSEIFPNNGRLVSLLFDKVDKEFESAAALLSLQTPKQSLFGYLD